MDKDRDYSEDQQLPGDWQPRSNDESHKIRMQLGLLFVLVFCWVGVLLGIAFILPDIGDYPV